MSTGEEERRKRAIFESMSPRRQEKILKKGYDTWDPFLQPKEPSRFFKGPGLSDTKADVDPLVDAFLRENEGHASSSEYLSGVKEICLGLRRGDQRYRGMCAFCSWMAARHGGEKGGGPDKE